MLPPECTSDLAQISTAQLIEEKCQCGWFTERLPVAEDVCALSHHSPVVAVAMWVQSLGTRIDSAIGFTVGVSGGNAQYGHRPQRQSLLRVQVRLP